MRNFCKPVALVLSVLFAPSVLAEPQPAGNWQERFALGIGGGPAYSAVGIRLDIPLRERMDLLTVLGLGGALGLQYRPLDSYPRLGFGVMYGTVAIASTKDEYGYEEEKPGYGASLFAGIAPRYDKFSVSAGVSYVLSPEPVGFPAEDYERTDSDAHWQASLGLHLPLRIRALGRLHR
ncbi:hypothetical protein ACQUQU_15895 [Thalassolituus sp. LLYu03]|uniref:hypothetical protein n=1 Tax=Thalassolituus sp. LLYu03 TaxID=3421656 RepID=UPI003D284B27